MSRASRRSSIASPRTPASRSRSSPSPRTSLTAQITSAAAGGTLPGCASARFRSASRTPSRQTGWSTSTPTPLSSMRSDGTRSRSSALDLVTTDDGLVGVPSDSWAQLLVYRKDLFEAAGLGRADDIRHDPRRRRGAQQGRAGRHRRRDRQCRRDSFTQQTFEYFALANGCQRRRRRRQHHAHIAAVRRDVQLLHEPDQRTDRSPGVQDADTTRAAYFAGEAAMIVWSSFLLDELAGLRDDALPTCDECTDDPLFLGEEQRHRDRDQRTERRRAHAVRRDGLVRDQRGRRHGRRRSSSSST